MMLNINNNQMSLNAQRQLSGSSNILKTGMERLSSGLRINSARDDVAGVAIADRMTSQIRGLNQAVRNANDGISLAQTAEGALQESTAILQRMRELSVQSANDTNTGTDRTSLQKEVGQLQQELNRIANTTAFNGKNLLDGSFSAQKFQVGANANQTISVSAGNAQASAIGAQQVSSATGAIVASSGAANSVGEGSLTINGSVGTVSGITVNAGDSARTIAGAVNEQTALTGVTARAQTQLELKVTSSGAVSFDLRGQNGSGTDAVSVSVNVSAPGTAGQEDLRVLAAAINDRAGTTGVTAKLNDGKDGLILENSAGYDISLVGKTNSSADITVGALTNDGTAVGTTPADINAGTASGAIVAGQVTFESGKSFSVVASGTNAVASGAAGQSELSSVGTIDISTQRGSNDAISVLDKALSFINDLRADLGAVQNRFGSTINNLQTASENISDARARIQDADFAKETAELSRGQILQQAGIAMLAQANQSQQGVLQLLR
ncbi:MAG: flagellin [Candidatus Competibacteraceae bacterium]|nr:MAG: flagellin [Candidatus Competibacteraceae bacterium]